MWHQCNDVLESDTSAKTEINRQQLKLILENHRLEMNLGTTNLLTELDFTSDAFLKRLYNYNLASNRDNYESMLDLREEFLKDKMDLERIKLWAKIQ